MAEAGVGAGVEPETTNSMPRGSGQCNARESMSVPESISTPVPMEQGGCFPGARRQVAEGVPASPRMVISRRGSEGFQPEQELLEFSGTAEENRQEKQQQVSAGPDHLLIMVNGIVGSADNWKYAAIKFREKLGDRLVIHRSARNFNTLTFHGVDVMGRRLAEEVGEVIRECPKIRKISFIAHSLGGLVARYAIAQLYQPADQGLKTVEEKSEFATQPRGTIAGLEPINFITVATPHLGSRGNKQLPMLCGLRCLEMIAILIAHWFVGRTGRHLFLADGHHNQPPLLRRMVTDCEEGMFMSALRCFKRRVAYANVKYDYMVGRRTSSIRRESELPKLNHVPVDPKYPHIVAVEKVLPESSDADVKALVPEMTVAPAADPIEEEMICALTQVPWERVDVSFHGSKQRFFAHSTIQVKTYPSYSDGADMKHRSDELFPRMLLADEYVPDLWLGFWWLWKGTVVDDVNFGLWKRRTLVRAGL